MVSKKAFGYLKSEYSESITGDKNSTTYERELKIKGNSQDHVKNSAGWIKSKVMP